MKYLRYLRSLLTHKWYVLVAGRRVRVPMWRLIVHDWSKFLPSEFIPYARYFYGDYLPRSRRSAVPPYANMLFQEDVDAAFDVAWLLHQNRQPHHWQFWYLIQDSDPEKALPMPEVYVREMVADWMGASKAYTGSWDMAEWLSKSGPRIERWMHTETVDRIHKVLYELEYSWGSEPWIFETEEAT